MPVTSILFVVIFAFALMALKLFNSLRTMQIQMGVGVVLSLYESPLLFWTVIALQCLALGVLLAIVHATYFVLPNQGHELRGTSALGPFETCPPMLRMSVHRGRPEVTVSPVKSTRMTRNGHAITGVSFVKCAFGRRFGIIATRP
jgi:hypothetical protein